MQEGYKIYCDFWSKGSMHFWPPLNLQSTIRAKTSMWDPNPIPFNIVLQGLHLNARNKVNLLLTHPDHKVYEEFIQRDFPSYLAHLTYEKIPVSICKAIEQKIAAFWWRTNEKKEGIHWKKWDLLKTRKDRGGMGFRDLISFNKAMLGKQAWHRSSTLWGKSSWRNSNYPNQTSNRNR